MSKGKQKNQNKELESKMSQNDSAFHLGLH